MCSLGPPADGGGGISSEIAVAYFSCQAYKLPGGSPRIVVAPRRCCPHKITQRQQQRSLGIGAEVAKGGGGEHLFTKRVCSRVC